MHQTAISPAATQRAIDRRGQLRAFSCLRPEQTALLVVDMQNGFVAPDAVAEVPAAREIVSNINRIGAALRSAGGSVVYIQNTFDAEAVSTWPIYFEHFCTPARRERMIAAFTPGAQGHALWPALEVRPQDLCVRKRRFSPFVPGSSELHATLRQRSIDTLIITGTVSQVCCESTARDATMLNYRVFFISDGNATFADAEHNATLSAMALTFCDVVSAETAVGLIGQALSA